MMGRPKPTRVASPTSALASLGRQPGPDRVGDCSISSEFIISIYLCIALYRPPPLQTNAPVQPNPSPR
jgi:hypothetical protein